MITAAHPGKRSTDRRRPQAPGGFWLGLLVGGLFASVAVTLLPLGRPAGRAAEPWIPAVALSPAEQASVQAVLSDAEQTRAAAVAYFSSTADCSQTECDAPDLTDHMAEIDEVVTGTIRARLIQVLGAQRAAMTERYLGPFVSR
jgi:hypothetical protein